MSEQRQFWFAAKRIGWGWGLPVRWQGWCVLAGYLALIGAGIYASAPDQSSPALFGWVAIATFAFVLIVAAKGEPPR
ncbi:MAG: hypothetical protein ABI565_12845 [Vicinamibacteria bacterium]